MPTEALRALAFDVFGTTVDWHSAVVGALSDIGTRHGIDADWHAMANAWRRKYRPYMKRVQKGELAWTRFDALQRMSLDECVEEWRLDGITDDDKDELTLAWGRARPWPDVVPGLSRLRARFLVSALSNGNLSVLVSISKEGGLVWDCLLPTELARAYKPDPAVYSLALELLDLEPDEAMMVAAHPYDLEAASSMGMRTALVMRPREFGAETSEAPTFEGADHTVAGFTELADCLGA